MVVVFRNCYWCVAPPQGLMPWLADVAFRMGQASNLTTITAASLSDDKSIASLTLATDKVYLPFKQFCCVFSVFDMLIKTIAKNPQNKQDVINSMEEQLHS